MSSGIVVAGMQTGVFVIHDIQVSVPHGVAVRITAEQAERSKDLWRGVQQGLLFKLSGGDGVHIAREQPKPVVALPDLQPVVLQNKQLQEEIVRLQAEKVRLLEDLQLERSRTANLQLILENLSAGFQGVHTALGKLEGTAVVSQASGPSPRASDVVAGDIPTFVPDRIQPDRVAVQIRTEKETTRTDVNSAMSRLRELKRGS